MQPTIAIPSGRATTRIAAHGTRVSGSSANVTLWIVQSVLAALFLFGGGFKLIMPVAALTGQVPVPGAFIRFIGVLEVSGALGLILPGILRTRRYLTPLAAAGLVFIMCGAVGVTLVTAGAAAALMPVVVGVLLSCVVYGRRHQLVALAPAERSVTPGGAIVADGTRTGKVRTGTLGAWRP